MLSIELPPALEHQFKNIVNEYYDGDMQAAIMAFLHYHNAVGWKVQLQQDVDVIRKRVQETGGISEQTIGTMIQRFRNQHDAFDWLNDPAEDGIYSDEDGEPI